MMQVFQSLLSPDKVNTEITTLKGQRQGVEKQLSEIKVIEPSSFYYEDKHALRDIRNFLS